MSTQTSPLMNGYKKDSAHSSIDEQNRPTTLPIQVEPETRTPECQPPLMKSADEYVEHNSVVRHTSPINLHPVYVNENSLRSKRNALQNPAYAKMKATEICASENSSAVSSPTQSVPTQSNSIYTKTTAHEAYVLMSQSFRESDEFGLNSPSTPLSGRTPTRQIQFNHDDIDDNDDDDLTPPTTTAPPPRRPNDEFEAIIPSPHHKDDDDTEDEEQADVDEAGDKKTSNGKKKKPHEYENCDSRQHPITDSHHPIRRNHNCRGGSVKNNIVKRNSQFINNRSSDIEFGNSKQDIINTTWKVNYSKVGQGGNGEIYKALTLDGKQVVIKIIKMRNRQGTHYTQHISDYSKKLEEINCLKMLKHPNIVKYYGAVCRKEFILIFMQYIANGSLTSVIETFGRLSELISANYTKQLLDAIEYMHSMNIVHRDIKCANILVTDDGVIKLIDFGCAKKNQSKTERRCNSDVGTSGFRSPESITGIGHGMKTDIWSLGCAVVEMLTGERPWSPELHEFSITYATGVGGKPKLNRKLQTGEDVVFSDKANAFIEECFKDIKERKNTSEMKLMPFVSIQNVLMPNLIGRKIDDILNLDKVLEK